MIIQPQDLGYKKKKRESRTVARSACRGLRIARYSRTSKRAEASRRICVNIPTVDAHAPTAGKIHISAGIYCLLHP